MNAETFCEYFATFAEAPGGVTKLRELILQLAVQGKLVRQDPNDEPAVELFSRIENERLTKSRKRAASRAIPDVTSEDAPRPAPDGWLWIRLADLAEWAIGTGFPIASQGHSNKPYLFAKVSDMNLPGNSKFIVATNNTICDDIAKATGAKLHPQGTVIFPKIGGAIATNKRRILTRPTAIDNNCLGLIPIGLCESEWLYLFLTSIDFAKYQSGTSVPALSQGTLELLLVGLPPLAEQRRIVAKVDQLLGLCDELAARQEARRTARERLVVATLADLTSPRDTTDRTAPAQRLQTHFDTLFDTPTTIPHLRQTILQLAVQGKLVPQDPNEVVKASKDTNTATSAGQAVFPSRWRLMTLESVCEAIVDCPHSTPKWTTSGKLCVRTNQFRPGFLDLSDAKTVSEATFAERIQRLTPQEDDILYSREGGILGIACRVPPNVELCLGQRMMLFRVGELTTSQFLELVLNSPHITRIARDCTTGGAAPRINVSTIRDFPIPVPPMAEQKRIVAKVTELLAWCDTLERQLQDTETASTQLLTAAVQQLLSATRQQPA